MRVVSRGRVYTRSFSPQKQAQVRLKSGASVLAVSVHPHEDAPLDRPGIVVPLNPLLSAAARRRERCPRQTGTLRSGISATIENRTERSPPVTFILLFFATLFLRATQLAFFWITLRLRIKNFEMTSQPD